MKLVLEFKEPQKKAFTSPEEVFTQIQRINIDYSQEHFLVFFLNTRNKLIDYEVLFIGGTDKCLIDPKVLFRKALLKGAHNLIISHNHPSGELTPSDADVSVYKQLKKIGGMLGIDILDSVIFTEDKFYSFVSAGIN